MTWVICFKRLTNDRWYILHKVPPVILLFKIRKQTGSYTPQKPTWQWKIHHEWRYICFWTWGFSNVILVFREGISWNFWMAQQNLDPQNSTCIARRWSFGNGTPQKFNIPKMAMKRRSHLFQNYHFGYPGWRVLMWQAVNLIPKFSKPACRCQKDAQVRFFVESEGRGGFRWWCWTFFFCHRRNS